ncbi:MAG: hypothetical protein LC122_13535 [Chitinophagales bacterium]|nr:hypothetical protein [Chitinophagales bacterium]
MENEKNKNDKKHYYDVKVETFVPAVFHYKILAKNPEEAEQMVKNKLPDKIDYFPNKRKKMHDVVLKIYDSGTIILRLIRHFVK